MAEVKVNEVYELYQIMTDFGDPLEIFREGIPPFSTIQIISRDRFDKHGLRKTKKVPRKDWWRYEKCVPEIVNTWPDGRINVFLFEDSEGAVR